MMFNTSKIVVGIDSQNKKAVYRKAFAEQKME